MEYISPKAAKEGEKFIKKFILIQYKEGRRREVKVNRILKIKSVEASTSTVIIKENRIQILRLGIKTRSSHMFICKRTT